MAFAEPEHGAESAQDRLRAESERLADVLRTVVSSLDLEETLGRIAQAGLDLLGASACAVALPGPDGLLRYGAVRGDELEFVHAFAFPPGRGFVGRSFVEQRLYRVADLWAEADSYRPDLDRAAGLHALVCAPLSDGEPLGVLVAVSRTPGAFGPDDERLLARLSDYAALALERARRHAAERARANELLLLTTELAEEQRRLAFLADASNVLSSSLDYETTLQSLARLAVPRLADWCFVDVVEADSAIRRVAVAHLDAEREALARDLRRRHPVDPAAPHGVARVVRTGESEFRPDALETWLVAPGATQGSRLTRSFTPASYMCVALRSRGRVVGALTLAIAESSRRFTPADLALAEDLAARAGLAVDNARLFRDASVAEREARALYRAAAAAGQEATLVARLDAVLGAALELTGTRLALVMLLDTGGMTLEEAVSRGQPAGPAPRTPLGSGLAGRVVAEGRPLRADDVQADPRVWSPEWMASQGVRSWLGVPLSDDSGAFGVLVVTSEQQAAFSAEDERRLAALAALAAAAVREARLRERLAEAEAVRELARLKDEFLSTVSHELRTPLSVVCGYAELLLTRTYTPERVRELIGEVNRAAQVMVRLVDDLLDLGQIERGELDLALAPLDLAAEVRAALARVPVRDAAHTFRSEVTPGLPPVLADHRRVQQVLANLIENAVRYASPGAIVLRALPDGRHARVEVEDSGPGLPPEVAARVFEKFYRAPDARLSRDRGTGIGLAVVRELVEAHGGAAGVRGTPAGSVFWFTLPLA